MLTMLQGTFLKNKPAKLTGADGKGEYKWQYIKTSLVQGWIKVYTGGDDTGNRSGYERPRNSSERD